MNRSTLVVAGAVAAFALFAGGYTLGAGSVSQSRGDHRNAGRLRHRRTGLASADPAQASADRAPEAV